MERFWHKRFSPDPACGLCFFPHGESSSGKGVRHMLKPLFAVLATFAIIKVGLDLIVGSTFSVDLWLGRMYRLPTISLSELPDVCTPIVKMFPVVPLFPSFCSWLWASWPCWKWIDEGIIKTVRHVFLGVPSLHLTSLSVP
jgi:hypothetical protein